MFAAHGAKTCYKCLDVVTPGFYHRDDLGWSCQFCAPEAIPCKASHLGCTYVDFPSKTLKHEFFFCDHSTNCGVCRERIPCSLVEHFADVHNDTAYRNGEKLHAYNNGSNAQYMLTDCGSVVVDYKLNNNLFAVDIMSPFSSDSLHKFTCAVQLFDPIKGTEFVNLVKEHYTDTRDWYFAMSTKVFPDWSGYIDIAVDVNANHS